MNNNNLSDNQLLFVSDAKNQGLDVDYDYSGRGMFGKTCPSVVVDFEDDFITSSKYKVDNMGLKIVMYAQY